MLLEGFLLYGYSSVHQVDGLPLTSLWMLCQLVGGSVARRRFIENCFQPPRLLLVLEIVIPESRRPSVRGSRLGTRLTINQSPLVIQRCPGMWSCWDSWLAQKGFSMEVMTCAQGISPLEEKQECFASTLQIPESSRNSCMLTCVYDLAALYLQSSWIYVFWFCI